MAFRPPLFFLTGLVWLILSALLGLGQFLGIVLGYPLPPALRPIHVHAALVGGVAQIILGGLLSFVPPLLLSGRDRPESHPILYVFVNAGALGMLLGFATGELRLVGVAGLFVLLAFLSVAGDAIRQARSSLVRPPLALWFYGVALLALFGGLALGLGLAFRLLAPGLLGAARLAHIHLNLLGFVTLTIVGTMHTLLPTVLQARLHSARLAVAAFALLPLGLVGLVAGFLTAAPWLQIGAGSLLLVGVLLYAVNMVRTWLDAGRPSSAAADHFIAATFFLVAAAGGGILVALNHRTDPPAVPFGTLHLVAYSHLALVGFILQTIFGALSHLLPIMLAVRRVRSNKKRAPYLARLTAIMERGRAVQVAALSLGAAGLAVVAALVWQMPLSAAPVQAAAWLSAALLLLALGLFLVKVGIAIWTPPAGDARREA